MNTNPYMLENMIYIYTPNRTPGECLYQKINEHKSNNIHAFLDIHIK